MDAKIERTEKNRKTIYIKESKQNIWSKKFLSRNETKISLKLGKYRFISLAKSCFCLKLFHCSWKASHYLRDSIPDFSGFGRLDNSPKNLSLKCPIRAWPGYQVCSIYSSGTITYHPTVCSNSNLVEESSNKLKVRHCQLKLMLNTPGHRLIAVLWEKINTSSLVAMRESPGRCFSCTSVLSPFRYVPHFLQGRRVVPSLGSLYIGLRMLGNQFSWSSPFVLICSERPEEEKTSDAPCVKLLQN